MKKRIPFSIISLTFFSVTCSFQANAMHKLLTEEVIRSSFPKRLIHSARILQSPKGPEILYDKARNQFHYYVERNTSIELLDKGKLYPL